MIVLGAGAVILVVSLGIGVERLASPGTVDAADASPIGQPTGPADAGSSTHTPIAIPPSSGTHAPAQPLPAVFDRTAFSIDDPASPWVVVNKQRPLTPVDYAPSDLVIVDVTHTWTPHLRAAAATAVVEMFTAATTEAGLALESNSAYRAYASQVETYASDVAAKGVAGADFSTARPGHSEHQTGWTMDIGSTSGVCRFDACFADTAEGTWLEANAWRFGFLLRYPADKVDVTGFEFEPWHFRFIGTELAAEMHGTGVTTLEEFFRLPAAPGY